MIDFATVKAMTDLPALMRENGIEITRSGMARCFLHGDKTPSLKVYPDQGRWWCFGCNRGGDCFDLCERFFRMSRREALSYLAGRAGIQVDKPITTEVRREIEEVRVKRRRREVFDEWIGAEKSRVAERIRYLNEEADIIGPESLGTNWAKRIYDELVKLEGRDEILWSHDDAAILELYEESIASG